MKKFLVPVIIFCGLIILSGCSPRPTRIMALYSYHPEYLWVQEEASGLEAALQQQSVEIEQFYLDTKRNPSAEWQRSIFAQALTKIGEYRPDIMVVFDDNACQFVSENIDDLPMPVVFAGMNDNPEDYGFPAPNVTGVLERIHLLNSIAFLRELSPNLKNNYLISDDSPTSRKIFKRFTQTELESVFNEIVLTNDFELWQQKIRSWQKQDAALGILLYHTLASTGNGQSIPSEEVIKWTLKYNRLPEWAVFDFVIQDGVLCGEIISGYEQGKVAGDIVAEIIRGRKPAEIPMITPETGEKVINLSRAEALGLNLNPALLEKYGK
ncbi:MAG: hypothetical protein JW784_02470 [Candidatus Cloacimonetes bacterium]|nr:hypothetical protein [Candidatus Cloacimonadota bacterium]